MSDLVPGQTILHYKVLEKIGQGGMGVVYKAEDTKLKRTVALKFLAPHILANDQEKSRFIHEAQAAAALHHPNICTVYEINESAGQTFISMAYLEGQTLAEVLADKRLQPHEAVKIALGVARGLKAAHENDVVHRDIKSSNIMIGPEGRATIMDFGLAKSVHQTHVTQHGTKLGTIAYMSPEQARGDGTDRRTDIWSLGVLTYEMLAGQRPFRGDYDEAVIYSILNEDPHALSEYVDNPSPDLAYVVQKAMSKDPLDRYASAADMVKDLEVLDEEMRTGSSSSTIVRADGNQKSRDGITHALFATRSVVIVAIYLVVAAASIMTLAWSTDRFLLSPHLVSIAVIGLLSLVPTVWILAARNGARTRAWRLVTRIGIPANVVVVLAVLFAIFAGRDIGAATETVAVRDETGQTITRVVPKDEFRKSLALYLPTNESQDTGFEWAETAIGALLEIDLSQDQFLYLRSGFDEAAKQRLEQAGFSRWADAPWTLKREMAEKANMDYFMIGSFVAVPIGAGEPEASAQKDPAQKLEHSEQITGSSSETTSPGDLVVVPEDATWEMTFQVHNSRSGKLVGQSTYRGDDLFALVDEASRQIRHEIGLPKHHVETAVDLPVSAMVTESLPALALFSKGLDLALFNNEWHEGLKAVERSVEYDSTFAYSHYLLFEFCTATNMPEKREDALQKTMRHIYKLPERVQFVVKFQHYGFAQEPEKALGVLELWTELYPNDVQGHVLMAYVRRQRGERDLAIEEFAKVLEIDPSRTEFLTVIAREYRQKGDFETSLSYYELYAAEHPNDADVFHSMGALYEIHGKYNDAREHYERALVIDPTRGEVLVELGDIHGKLSEDKKALETWQKALEMSKTPQERARIYGSLRNFYSNRGQMTKSLEHVRLVWAEEEQFLSPVSAQLTKLEEVRLFIRGGRPQESFDEMKIMEAQVAPPYDGIIPLGYACIYIELEDADKAEKALMEFESFIEAYHVESERGWIHWGRAKVAELRGEHETAIELYQKNLDMNPSEITMHREIGRCYRKLDQNEKALESLERLLLIYPGNPTANYEAALAHKALGNQAKAEACLQKALDRWKDADPIYDPAQRARATLAEWSP